MENSLFLSQASISAFLTCKRRFQIRYLERLSWPDTPFTPQQQIVINRGQQFHQIMERYFLGLPTKGSAIQDTQVQRWWDNFQRHKPDFPKGRRLPEHRLTVPTGRHFLIGRFDLLITGERAGQPYARLYDWKTSRPRPESELKEDWQTRLYLAMLAESGQALTSGNQVLTPEDITITYWFAGEPDASQTIVYNRAQHTANWKDIQEIVVELERIMPQSTWPLTDNWSHCRKCLYQTYCGRQEVGHDPKFLAEEDPIYDYEFDFLLEPDSP